MREIKIPYGKGFQYLHIEEEKLHAVLCPEKLPRSIREEDDIVEEALANPIASARLRELVKGKNHILLITSDHTRPVPSRITIPHLMKEIREGNPQAEVIVLIATGMHRRTTQEELAARFGEKFIREEKILIHDAYDESSMRFFGTLPSGGELWLNGKLAWADLVIAEGFIEPHFFAGFSGGRKAILPGIAAEKTVRYNHNARFIASPMARQGSLTENPIHQDMLYAAKQAGLAFILNVILDEEKRICAAVAGDPEKAHLEGCRICETGKRLTPVPSEIAVTSNGGYPLDQNVYQSVKGMTAGEACVKPGGVLIMNAALGDGHGGEHFFRWFADRADPDAVMDDIIHVAPEETHFDQWEAQILARVLQKASCIFVTGEENRALIEQMHMQWAPDADTALSAALSITGPESKVTVIPDGVGVIF